jgi:hypothetical protein
MKQHYLIAMILFILLMLWVASELFHIFETKATATEGFSNASQDITLNMCPLWAPQVQTAKGNTDCCEGELLDGKCSSRTFCTLSPPHDTVPSCMNAWKSYFAEKSKQCPSTMPNYYEDVKTRNGAKGCSASKPKQDGSTPQNMSASRCVIYASEKENRERPNSCFVEKERLKIRCPPFAGYTSRVENVLVKEGGTDKFGSYVCSYTNALGQRNSCNDEKSLIALWDRQDPNWRVNSGKYTQLREISCTTFVDRERKKEMERQRLEAERRRTEEERKKREAAESKFRGLQGFFARFRRQAQEAAARARRAAEEQKRRSQQALQQMRNRLKRC